MNIILYGPPGVGKTTVGNALAGRLGREFVDSDRLIENYAGRSIPHIFSQLGEAEFRRLESKVCLELAARQNAVIGLGGGALINRANRAALERGGLVICLHATPDELLARLVEMDRPLLAGDNPAERLNALLSARHALYESFPTQIDTNGKTAAEVVSEIAS